MASSRSVSEPIQCIRFLSVISYDIEFNCFQKVSLIFLNLSVFRSPFCQFLAYCWKLQAKHYLIYDTKLIFVSFCLKNGFLVLVLKAFIQNFVIFWINAHFLCCFLLFWLIVYLLIKIKRKKI